MYVTTDSLGRSEIHDGNPSRLSGDSSHLAVVPLEYRAAYEHASNLARALERKDKPAQAAEAKWLSAQGWQVQLPSPDEPFKAILVSNPALPKKIRVNVIL